MIPTIELLANQKKRFLFDFPWVYSNEIKPSPALKEIKPGEITHLVLNGKFLATGYFNPHSLIAFRSLTRKPNEKIDADFFKRRIEQAEKLRQVFYKTPFYRLVHAESDDLPGLIIDRFDKVFVVQLNTQGMEKLESYIVEALEVAFKPDTILLQYDSGSRKLEGLEDKETVVQGKPVTLLKVKEDDLEFSIDFSTSQKTGWFFDNRDNRAFVGELSQNKTMIDYYCYSGGFSLHAAHKGAKRVIGVDSSKQAIANAQHSAKANGLQDRASFVVSEVFKDMDARIEANESFEVVMLDPPAFVKSKKDLGAGLKGYEKLLAKGLTLTASQGFLVLTSCSYHVKASDLIQCLNRACDKTNRRVKIVKELKAGFDHPIHPRLPETDYLKGFIFYCP